jgi:dihydropteroate synthase
MKKYKTQIVGILNVTPDSFSDGGKYFDSKKAIYQLEKMLLEGADIIDIGAQSTRPNAEIISSDQEWERLKPVFKEIKKNNIKAKISLDSFNLSTIEKAMEYGLFAVNDVKGFENKKLKEIVSRSNCKAIVMHSLTIPADKNITLEPNIDIIDFLNNWQKEKKLELEKAGIKPENIIFDLGIGFGKTANQSLKIILNIEKLKQMGQEILIGHSEKSFLSIFTNSLAGDRVSETKIFSFLMSLNNVDYLRVHNVLENKKMVELANEL